MKERIVEILKGVNSDITGEEKDLISEGLLNSLQIFELMDNLEEAFGIAIQGADIRPDRFLNAEAIESLVQKYVD